MSADQIPAGVSVVINLKTASEHALSRLRSEGTDLVSKTEANYRPVIGPDCCGVCAFGRFRPGENVGTCTKVAGPIRWKMISDLYESKTAGTSDSPTDPA